ncbi:MAG: EAL domain-containing protein [Casimicrobiaceae bacterium]
MAAARILVVDDELSSMRALCDTLRTHGYETEGHASGETALAALAEGSHDLLLTDLMMPGMDGVALLRAAQHVDPQIVGVLMTGMGTIETAVHAMQAGALDYVLKPIKLRTLLPVVERALGVRRLRLENMQLRDTVALHQLNEAMAHTLDRDLLLQRIADAAMAQLRADEASVMLVNDDDGTLQIVAVRGPRREALLGRRVPGDEGIAGWVATHREPLVLAGGVSDPRWMPRHPRADIQSALSLPMVARNELVGVININCIKERRAFTQGQVKMLGIFTNAAAAAIQAARMHDAQRKSDARYREVLQMAADGIISLDADHRIVVFNARAESMFGYAAAEVSGRSLDLLLPPEGIDPRRHWIRAFMAAPELSRTIAGDHLLGCRKDGTLFNAEIDMSKRADDVAMQCTMIVRDVTLRIRQAERIVRLSRLYAVLSGINTAIVRILDEVELYEEICRIAVDKGGFNAAFVGSFDADARAINVAASAGGVGVEARHVADASGTSLQRLLARALAERKVVWEGGIVVDGSDGIADAGTLARDARATAVLPFEVDGAVRAVMVVQSAAAHPFGKEEQDLLREMAGDVSFALDHIGKKRQIEYVATHDLLTGLPNRSLFLDRLAQAIAAARTKGESVAVVLADIERFKHLNDALGRHAGDMLLKQLAGRIRNATEGSASLARVGGDVFASIFTGFDRPAEVARRIYHLGNLTVAPFMLGGQPVSLTMRAGTASFPANGNDAEAIFHNAEAALKRAKDLHEPLVFYTPDLNASVAQRLAVEGKLRRALERREFVLHYQPKVDLRSGAIVGLEALIRWNDPQLGIVPAAQFVTILEETGLIVDVGRWAMKEAVRQVVALRAAGAQPMRIAVNVSSIQLRQDDFVRWVEDAIAVADGAPHGLDLEITESVLMHDIESNVRKLNDVRSLGVDFAIDDFGTGYSSLAYLARLPIAVVKIDRSFVSELTSGASGKSIVSTIISLAHTLDMIVVAEGVETDEQCEMLRSLKCDQFQGYLFSKPVSGDEIGRMLMRSIVRHDASARRQTHY